MASNEPELPEGWAPSPQGCWLQNHDTSTCFADGALRVQYGACIATVPLSVLRSLLGAHGLHIVDAKDWAVPVDGQPLVTPEAQRNLTHPHRKRDS